MTYVLGVDVGTTFTAAALWRDGRAETVPLGNRAHVVPSVVFLREDGELLVGEAAERRAVSDPARVGREFKRRVGDAVPLMLGGDAVAAQALMGRMLEWVVERVTEREGGRPSHVTVTYPAMWSGYRRGLLAEAAASAGLGDVGLVAEPVAAAIYYASRERLGVGDAVGVYDLGGGTFDATVLRRTASGFELVGQPSGEEQLGGVDFDQALMEHVVAALGGAWAALDLTDPVVVGAVAQLRARVVEAKEALSSDVETSVPVVLPGLTREVRLTRGELEELVRDQVIRSISTFRMSLEDAGVPPSALRAILLVGGSSRIPLVAELIATELGVPVAVDTHPKFAVCLGAAIAAAARLGGTDGADEAQAARRGRQRLGRTAAAAAQLGAGAAVQSGTAPAAVEADPESTGLLEPVDLLVGPAGSDQAAAVEGTATPPDPDATRTDLGAGTAASGAGAGVAATGVTPGGGPGGGLGAGTTDRGGGEPPTVPGLGTGPDGDGDLDRRDRAWDGGTGPWASGPAATGTARDDPAATQPGTIGADANRAGTDPWAGTEADGRAAGTGWAGAGAAEERWPDEAGARAAGSGPGDAAWGAGTGSVTQPRAPGVPAGSGDDRRRQFVLLGGGVALLAALVLGGVAVIQGLRGDPDDNPGTTLPASTTAPPTTAPPGLADAEDWVALDDAPAPHEAAGAATFDGKVWVAGGTSPVQGRPNMVEVQVFDPATESWSAGPELPQAMSHGALVSDGESLWLVGGDEGRPVDTVLRLDDPDGAWVEATPLPEPRSAGAAAWDGSRIVFAGGLAADGADPSDEVWALQGDEWELVGRLQAGRDHLAAASDGDGTVWFLAGHVAGTGDRSRSGLVDAVTSGGVEAAGEVARLRAPVAFWSEDTGPCVTGGQADDGFNGEVSCLEAGAGDNLPELLTPRAGASATVVDGRAVYVVGGFHARESGGIAEGSALAEVLAPPS